ncbi:cation transporting ATPase C-terminal domain-containing protein [Liquorilactobacillus hordei]
MIYTPFLQEIFNTQPLNLIEWFFLFCIPIPLFLLEELRKFFVRKTKSHN